MPKPPVVLIITEPATDNQIEKMSYPFGRYIKVVVDIEKEILAGGAEMHVDEEQLLLEYGSQQRNLWGGGVDLESRKIDYNSMINQRPNQGNPSREVSNSEIRDKMDEVIKRLLL